MILSLAQEYVIDHVSRDGVHKTVMLWKYDKRPANGGPFVYHGVIPVDSESPEAKLLIPYIRGVLDALGFKNGASHGEAIMTSDGPCLVEMNCRAHGADGNWAPLCQELVGYTQIDAAVDSYLDKERFEELPNKYPSPFKAFGQEVDLVSFSEGFVKSTPGFDVIKMLPSFVSFETLVKPSSTVHLTVDLVTAVGAVILMNHDKEALENDIRLIRQLEQDNLLFEYQGNDKPDAVSVCPEEDPRQMLLDAILTFPRPRRLSINDPTDLYW